MEVLLGISQYETCTRSKCALLFLDRGTTLVLQVIPAAVVIVTVSHPFILVVFVLVVTPLMFVVLPLFSLVHVPELQHVDGHLLHVY